MKNLLRFLVIVLISLPFTSRGQATFVLDGMPGDSVVFNFAAGDSLTQYNNWGSIRAMIDTTGARLWQVGGTVKTGFLNGGNAVRGIMTDTAVTYPIGQDDYFVLRDLNGFNPILTFDHRYETTAGKDGGCVELSNDSGATWKSIFQLCNDTNTNNNPTWGESVLTDSFYTRHDTLANGIPVFSGSSNGYIRSRLQLFYALPLKTTQAPCNFWNMDIWVRFRFMSDSTADTLAGWNIRRILLEYDRWEGVTNTSLPAHLSFSPNPTTGLLRLADDFPLTPGQRYQVRDVLGRVVLREGKPERTLDLGGLPKGLYFVQVQGRNGIAVGRVVLE